MVSPKLMFLGFLALVITFMGVMVIGASLAFIGLALGALFFAYFLDMTFRLEGSTMALVEALLVMGTAFYTKNVDYTALAAISFALGITVHRLVL